MEFSATLECVFGGLLQRDDTIKCPSTLMTSSGFGSEVEIAAELDVFGIGSSGSVTLSEAFLCELTAVG